MKSRTRDKAISLLLTINLIFNSFAPFLTFARPVVSAEPLKAEIDFKTIENSFDISVNTKEEVEYVLSWKNQDGLQGTSIIKAGGEDQEFQRDIYAGIKSGPDARRDTVIRGIYKVEVKSQHWITAIKFSLDDGKLIEENKTEYLPEGLDFTDNEIKWIEEGDQVTPTPTLEATSTPTPTIVEQGDILEGASDQNFMTSDVDGVVQTNVIESYQCRADSLNGCLITDKEDYAATEVALITGYGFAPNTEYTIRISSSDEPAVTYEALVTTDEHGSFTVSYQLDGTYRPSYLVQLFDSNGVEVTRVTFTDSPTKITAKSHEGQKSDSTWTSGNITQYSEGDLINFRFNLEATHGPTSGQIEVRYSEDDGSCLFFDGSFTLGAIIATSGSQPIINTIGSPVVSGGEWIQTLNINYPSSFGHSDPNSVTQVNYTLRLSEEAGQCNGSSQHSRLNPAGGTVEQTGAQNVPVPANQVIELPEVTIIKKIDRDGNGSFESYASVGEYCFTLDSGICTPTNSSGQVLFTNVIPDGNHTITETQLDYTHGTHQFVFGAGNNCTFEGSTATASVASGTTPVNATCEFNNAQTTGMLVVKKVVVNNYGGTKNVSDFSFRVDNDEPVFFESDGQNNLTVNAGTYTITEPAVLGYTTSYDNCSNVVVPVGGSATCTITNNDQPATLIVKKVVVNDNGGSLEEDDFTFIVNDGDPVAFEADGQNDLIVNAGTYTITEPSVAGYNTSYNNCTDVVVTNGGTATCTITNNDSAPSLGLRKTITKDNGGQNNAIDWTLTATGTGDTLTNLSGTTPVDSGSNFKADTYTLGETGPSGYTAGNWTCTGGGTQDGNKITLGLGESAICTINNDDQPGRLIVKKVLTQDDGGDEDYEDFSFKVNGGSSIDFESDGQNEITVNSGTYTVVENTAAGYDTSYSNCTDVFVPNGGSATCTITNDDIAPTLKLQKNVLGSEALDAGDWDLTASGEAGFTDSGDSITFHEVLANETYALTESMVEGYTAGNWSCDNTGVQGNLITLGLDEEVTCTITNTRDTGNIEILKLIDLDGDLSTADDREPYQGWVVDVDQDGVDTDDPTLPVTDSEGKSSATGIKTGEYWVSEGSVQGYEVLSGTCTVNGQSTGNGGLGKSSFGDVTVAKDTTTYCTFINAPNSTLHGYKWHDEDLSGGTEAGNDEDLLSDWTIYLYKAIDEGVYSLVDSMVTDNGLDHFGWYWFENLVPGDYRICEENQAGWNQTYPINDIDNCHEVSLPLDSSGEMITREVLNAVSGPMYNFGNVSLGKVNVTKYNDLNGNGMRDDGEPTLPDWEITLSGMDSIITDENGVAEFDGVVPGNYVLDEVIQDGWEQTAITCSVPVDPTPTPTTPVDLTGTPTPTPVSFNNICHWNEGADKWNALSIPDSNKGHDDHEMDYPYGGNVDSKGHPVKDPHQKDDPELNGDAWCEANKPNQLTSVLGLGIGAVEAQEVEIDGQEVTVEPGKIVNCEIGNRQINPELQISKSNDADGDRSNGDTVVYTLKVKALTSQVLEVVLKDLLPEGFTFQNVISIIRNGTDDLTAMVGNPNYASPGTYNLGDMNADDEIIIKYAAKVGDVTPGRYKDLAYATGRDVLNNRVVAQAQTDGYVSTNFVGTSVNIFANLTQSGDISIEGEVLGASTFLPATGGDAYWIIMATLLTVMGLLFMILGFLVKRGKLAFKVFGKIVAGIALIGLFIFSPVTAEASPGDLSIRLEQAKSPTSINQFTLTYVVMDLSESPAPIQVKCFKKGPSDGGYSQFGPTQDVSAGGNSGKCEVNQSVVSANGTYQFYVTANNGTDSATSESEGIISVGYNTVGDPVPPVTYKKEKVSSCQYKITFKTADDSKTERVEIYRSESTSFKLDGSTRVADITIGPNQTGDFVETVPDCEKNYYYAMRSFNSAGNPSGPVGDSSVTVTTTSVSDTGETSSAIQVINVTLPGGAQGEVLGEGKEATESSSADENKEEVKGVAAVAEKAGDFVKTNRNYIIGLLGLIIAVTVYVLIKKRKKTIDF